jgi:hypothetical protein
MLGENFKLYCAIVNRAASKMNAVMAIDFGLMD